MELPDDILKIISNKLLRLILDEVEDDSQLLSKKESNIVDSFMSKYMSLSQYYESCNNIDYIIKLIRMKKIGADPNIKNYKGNTILYLLIKEVLETSYLGIKDKEYQTMLGKINLLHNYKANFNIKNSNGDTIAHMLISTYIQRERIYDGYHLIRFCSNLGMTVNKSRNDQDYTAYELGICLINPNKSVNALTKSNFILKLNMLISHETKYKLDNINEEINMLNF
jgi:hypothetical protein